MRGTRRGEPPFDLEDPVRVRHDFERGHPFTNTVVSAIASTTDSDSFEIPPLNESVDPDAVNAIVDTARSASEDPEVANLGVVFPHHDRVIGVSGGGRIAVSGRADDASTEIKDALATDFSADAYTVRHDWDSNTSLAATVVRAIASVTGLEPSTVYDRLNAVVDLAAMSDLFRPKADGTPRLPGGVRFSFRAYEVTVLDDGTIVLQSTLMRLKRTGGNLLLVGAVPDDVISAASAPLLGTNDLDRAPLFALYETDVETARERLSEAGADRTDARVVTCRGGTRATAAARSRPSELHVSEVDGELDELRAAIGDAIAEIDRERDDLTAAELRFCFDSLEPLVRDHDSTTATAFLESVCDAVGRVSGMGHYVLPAERTADPVGAIEPLFDSVIELRVTSDGPEQRWSFRTTGYTTEWFPLSHVQ